MIWIIYFVEGMLSGTTATLNPFVTSAFAQQSLTPTVCILSGVIGGVTNLTVAKVLDVLGRPQGFLLCIILVTAGLIFALWERFFAPIAFIPYSLLLDPTVFSACILSATLFVSYFCWASYFSSFLMVVNDLSVADASYVVQAYTVGTVLCNLAVGVLIHCTGRFKAICLYFSIPLSILGMGLMTNFRWPDGNIGYIVMCQISISFGAGTVIICDEIAAMAAASHQHIAVVIAVLGLFGSIGGAIGLTVAAAIWQNVLPKKLAKYLPAEELANLPLIYADITTQLSYTVGSLTRIAIQHAYGDAQLMILIAGTAVWALGIVAVVMW
jgi:hypothetical protein